MIVRIIVSELKLRTIYVAIYIFSLTAHVILDQQFLISNKGLAISCSNVSKWMNLTAQNNFAILHDVVKRFWAITLCLIYICKSSYYTYSNKLIHFSNKQKYQLVLILCMKIALKLSVILGLYSCWRFIIFCFSNLSSRMLTPYFFNQNNDHSNCLDTN